MLIDLEELDKKARLDRAARHQDKLLKFISPVIADELQQQIAELQMGESIHFETGARWSLNDLIVHCLNFTGPVDVYMAFYAVKEYQVRLLLNMQTAGLIKDIHTLLFYRAGTHDPGAVQLLANISKTYGTMRTHAKLVCLRNEHWAVNIVTSANLTKNTQADVGVITCNVPTTDSWINWIKKNIADGIER